MKSWEVNFAFPRAHGPPGFKWAVAAARYERAQSAHGRGRDPSRPLRGGLRGTRGTTEPPSYPFGLGQEDLERGFIEWGRRWYRLSVRCTARYTRLGQRPMDLPLWSLAPCSGWDPPASRPRASSLVLDHEMLNWIHGDRGPSLLSSSPLGRCSKERYAYTSHHARDDDTQTWLAKPRPPGIEGPVMFLLY
jgi:hypothetical protein